MPIEKKIYEPDFQTDRAKNVKGEQIYIENAESGRQGYFCIGCDKPMQANIQRKNPNHRSYFSHIPVDLSKGEKKCTYSNREQRELIATDILQRIKIIKVPGVLKFPPKGDKRNPVELSKAKFISAYKVRSQLTFYEDEEGKVHNGKNPDIDERYLLLRPDVTFFNEKDEPVLFIELVVTHKITDEKKIKLRRLGIDTVSVIVPRGSDQEIADNFKSVQRVKWEYNDKEARTSYLSVSDRAPEGVLEFDEQQRRIFGESASCRRSRINNTIRSLRKCLEGKSYSDTERDFEREIFRIKNAAEGERERLENLEKEYRAEVSSGFNERFQELQQKEGVLRREEEEFRKYKANLEGRYFAKAEEIEVEQAGIEKDKSAELEYGGTEEEIKARFGQRGELLRDEFEEISEDWKRIIGEREESIGVLSSKTKELTGIFGRLKGEEQERFKSRKSTVEDSIRKEYKRKEEGISIKIRREEQHIRELLDQEVSLREEFGEFEKRELEEFRKQEARIKEEEGRIEEEIREELIRELHDPSSGLPKELGFILEAQRVGHYYKDAECEEARYKRAREFFKKGTWKK